MGDKQMRTIDVLSQSQQSMDTHLIAGMEVPPPDTMGQTFDLLAQEGVLSIELASGLKKAVGFRNIAVLSYESINWNIVHSIVKYHLADFSEFAGIVAVRLET